MVCMQGKRCVLECIELQHINFISWQTGTAAVAVLSAFKRNIAGAYWRVGLLKKKKFLYTDVMLKLPQVAECHFPWHKFWHILSSGTKVNIRLTCILYTVPVQIFVQSLNRVIRVIFLQLLNFLTNTEDITLNKPFLSLFKYSLVDHPQTFFQNYFILWSLHFR